jgi:hypothetical protein
VVWLIVWETLTSGSSIAFFGAAEVYLKGVTHKYERVHWHSGSKVDFVGRGTYLNFELHVATKLSIDSGQSQWKV